MGDGQSEDQPFVDYLAPFETFQAYGLRNGTIYRGRVRAQFAADRQELERFLSAAPGEHRVEEIDGRVYAVLRIDHRPRRRRLWLHIGLLVLTMITALGAGAELSARDPRPVALIPFEFVVDVAAHVYVGEGSEVVNRILPGFMADMQRGLPYAVALLFILLSHEMGHYLAARRYGVDATLPFLIPAPLLFGTFGAIIRMRSPITHRRSLFDIGVGGPIAGLAASLIVCVIGLSLSWYLPKPIAPRSAFELGNSALFVGLTRLVLGPAKPIDVVQLHPVAIAGWFGLFITFLNLMPLGQLDGGHVWYALIGRKQRYVAWAAFGLLLVMGYVFVGWVVLAALALLLLRVRHPAVMDESVSLDPRRKILGVFIIVVFVLLFVPRPITPL